MLAIPDILRGMRVFPVSPGTKDPATAHWKEDASASPAKLAEWQAINPEFNYAVPCGANGVFVFDVDPAGLDWWHKLLERDPAIKAAVDAAFQVRTPKGGLHVYFKGEGPTTASKIAEGIDTRGGMWDNGKLVSSGYVVGPGSATKAGPGRVEGIYEALPGGAINPLPDCLKAIVPERKKGTALGLLKDVKKDNPRNIQTAMDLIGKYVADGRVSIEGSGGDNTAFAVVASILDKGISPGTAYELLWEHWNPHCAPPWADWELEQKIENALKYGEDTEGGVKGFQANADAFANFIGQEFEPPVKEKRSRFAPMWLIDARKDVRPASWLIPGFVPSEGAGILYGLSGSYKTFIALDWALCLAHGIGGQWGAAPVKHTVLFLAGESSYALRQERVDAWCERWGCDPDDARFIIVPGVPAYSDTEGWQEIRDGLAAMDARPDFVVVDTLTRMMTGMDENSNDDGKLILGRCEEIAQHYGAFVLGIGHTGKDQSKGMRGAQVMIDNSEVVHFAKKSTNGTSLIVKKLKEVDIPADIFYLEVQKFGESIVLERTATAPFDPEQKTGKPRYGWASQEEVVRTLEGMGGTASNATLAQEISGRHGIEFDLVKAQLLKNTDLAWLRPTPNTWAIPKAEYDL